MRQPSAEVRCNKTSSQAPRCASWNYDSLTDLLTYLLTRVKSRDASASKKREYPITVSAVVHPNAVRVLFWIFDEAPWGQRLMILVSDENNFQNICDQLLLSVLNVSAHINTILGPDSAKYFSLLLKTCYDKAQHTQNHDWSALKGSNVYLWVGLVTKTGSSDCSQTLFTLVSDESHSQAGLHIWYIKT